MDECPAGALALNGKTVSWGEKKCVSCDRCIAVCPNYASPKIREMSAEEGFEEVSGNLPFIRGITVSGGECCLYPEFLEELFGLSLIHIWWCGCLHRCRSPDWRR